MTGTRRIIYTYALSGASGIERLTFGGKQPLSDLDREQPHRVSVRSRGRPRDLLAVRPSVAPPNASPSPNRAHRMFRSPGLRRTTGSCSTSQRGPTCRSGRTRYGTGRRRRSASVHSSDPTNAVFSPDGRWVAYTSTERNRAMIYVQPFPASGAQHQLPGRSLRDRLATALVSGREGTVLQPGARPIRVGQRHDSTDVYIRESRDGTETVPNRSSHRAKGVRHHPWGQVRRFEPSGTNGVRHV